MDLATLKATKYEAREKWREYKDAEKSPKIAGDTRAKSIYKELGKIYHQIKQGKIVIDIFETIKRGGVKEGKVEPALAVTKAVYKLCNCAYAWDGTVVYRKDSWMTSVYDIQLEKCLPIFNPHGVVQKLQCPVPMIPPKYRPSNLTNDYYILWEVDHWKNLPSADPYLLRKLSNKFYVVLEGWDLTPLEVAVIKYHL